MTDNDRNMLMDIHTQTALTTKEVQRLSKVIEGNGKPGLLSDVSEIRNKQNSCIKQRGEEKNTFRWKIGISVTVLAVIISAITTVTLFILN